MRGEMEKKYLRMRKFMEFLFGVLSHTVVKGQEHVPAEGSFILATNHVSRLDSPVLLIATPRRVYGLVANKYRRFIGFNWLLKAVDPIWIRRGDFDREALMRALGVLRQGHALAIAPEGTRSDTGKLQNGKPGVAFLAARLGVPIVPVAITGTEKMLEDFKRLRRMHIHIKFGPLFRLPKEGKLSGDELEAYTELVMHRIAELLPAEYRGVYAGATLDSGESGETILVGQSA